MSIKINIIRGINRIHVGRMKIRVAVTNLMLEKSGLLAPYQLADFHHGQETAFLLMEKYKDDFFAPVKSQLAFSWAAAKALKEGKGDKFLESADTVREMVLAL